jgi:hypothetical protein
VAMRYPYVPTYHDAYFETLKKRIEREAREDAEVVALGASKGDRKLWLARLGPVAGQGKPCLLVYAREHGTEPDGSWAAEGLIELLRSETEESRRIRREATVLVVPMLDPDAAARAAYEDGIHRTFGGSKQTPEAAAYAAFFRAWTDAGGRLDVALNLHNIEGGQVQWHAFPLLDEKSETRRAAKQCLVEKYIKARCAERGIGVKKAIVGDNAVDDKRLGGYLQAAYGTMQLAFELNVQARPRHLTLAEARTMGALIGAAAARFLAGEDAKALRTHLDGWRAYRAAQRRCLDQFGGEEFKNKSIISRGRVIAGSEIFHAIMPAESHPVWLKEMFKPGVLPDIIDP